MANYYTDIPELKFHLNNPMMKRICELKERNYRDKDEFDYAPLDFEDAVDSYDKCWRLPEKSQEKSLPLTQKV